MINNVMSIIRVNKVTYIILMKIKKKCIFILLISDVEFFFQYFIGKSTTEAWSKLQTYSYSIINILEINKHKDWF